MFLGQFFVMHAKSDPRTAQVGQILKIEKVQKSLVTASKMAFLTFKTPKLGHFL